VRGGCGRVRGDRDCRERLIFDVNPLGCVLCDLKRLGDDHRHRLATKRALSAAAGSAARLKIAEPSRFERETSGGSPRTGGGNGREALCKIVSAGEHGEHAGHRDRRGRVDRHDARVRVRRAHHHGVGLPGKIEVVAEAPLAGE